MTINQTKITSFFYQHSYPSGLESNKKYEFTVTHSLKLKDRSEFQLVFELNVPGDREVSHSLLQTFAVGTERCNQLIERFFPLDTSCNFVTAVATSAFEGCEGVCTLIECDDKKLDVDISSITVEYYTSSPLHEEFIMKESSYRCKPYFMVEDFENFFVQPNISPELKLGYKYDFIPTKHHVRTDGTIQMIFALSDDDGNCNWLLEEFTPGSPRFNDFVSAVYSIDTDKCMVVEVSPYSICEIFSGACELEEHAGRLRINWSSVELGETLHSSLFNEQVAAQRGGEV